MSDQPEKEITREEVEKRLRARGIEPNQWGSSEAKKVKIPMQDRQRAVLEAVLVLLEEQVQKDHQTRMRLRETLKKIEHGGGS